MLCAAGIIHAAPEPVEDIVRNGAKVMAGDVERIGPVTYALENNQSELIGLSLTQVRDLCSDGDGCTMRMLVDDDDGAILVDTWWFFINDADQWHAAPSGRTSINSGDVSDTDNTVVFAIGFEPACALREATYFDVVLKIRRFELSLYVDPIQPAVSRCVLRIDD